MLESDIVGIDLGTSNTLVAAMVDGQPTTLGDAEGNVLIPSAVSMLDGGTVLVGYPARERRFVDPKNTVLGAKRLVGRTWSDPALQEAKRRLPFELRRGNREAVRVVLHDEFYALPEISAFVLRKAKAVAEEALGRVVDRAIITVPANFNELQRQATKLAGLLADLDVVQVLNEPTAAAIAYGWGKEASERVAVYDFGGGTFDLTLLTLHEEVFRVRGTGGDMFLGGDDIDLAIANAIADAIRQRHYFDPRTNPVIFDRVRDAGERLKFLLSTRDDAAIEIRGVVQGHGGRDTSFHYGMTKRELDRIARPIVSRTIDACRAAFARAKLTPSQFDKVVLVGGSTRMRIVREMVAEYFGKEPDTSVSPDEAIALGAAIQGVAMRDAPRRARPDVIDIDLFELAKLPTPLPPPGEFVAPPSADETRAREQAKEDAIAAKNVQADAWMAIRAAATKSENEARAADAMPARERDARRARTRAPIVALLAVAVVAIALAAVALLWIRATRP